MSDRALVDELQALTRRLTQLRGRPPAVAIRDLERTAAELRALVPRLAAAEARLTESRGLDLEAVREASRRARGLDLDAAADVVRGLRAVGRVRSAARAFRVVIERAPRDAAWGDRVAGLGHLLEEFGELRGAGMCRALAASLPPRWWKDQGATLAVEDGLKELVIAWDRLPEAP